MLIMATTSPLDALGDWVDSDAIRRMVESVRAAYTAAPEWVQIALPVVLAIGVVVGILRVAASLAGRIVAVAVIAAIAAALWLYGSDEDWFPPEWLSSAVIATSEFVPIAADTIDKNLPATN